jgi:hypothetical protein
VTGQPGLHPALVRLLEQDYPEPCYWPEHKDAARELLATDPLAYIRREHDHDPLPPFVKIASALDDETYWVALGWFWVHHDVVHPRLRLWRALFRSPRPRRECLMTEGERDELDTLPSHVAVYRGFCVRGGEDGLAWTLDEDLAYEFAKRWAGYSRVPDDGLFIAHAVIPRERVLALFRRESRDGAEVIVPSFRGYPRRVQQVMEAADLRGIIGGTHQP